MSQAFDYQVRDRSGKVIRGRIEAESPSVVTTKLQRHGLCADRDHQGELRTEDRDQDPGDGQRVKLKDLAISAPVRRNDDQLWSILRDQTENKALGEFSPRYDCRSNKSSLS